MLKVIMIITTLLGMILSVVCMCLMDSFGLFGRVISGFFAVVLPFSLMGLFMALTENKMTESDDRFSPWCVFVAYAVLFSTALAISNYLYIGFIVFALIGLIKVIIDICKD